ncbi:Pr6Pr family membrane protein [Herbaspirillum sp. RV1423]|uniref:Pr6Pr family membrane protein n=1 Tax=Herbaspirillum sp. RV1423 TaxID=1443993 RepID=UPI0004AE5CCC|nr:Pr6Pr family membrane protein [Herbaspirillum sp. RV1423]
MSTPTPEPTLSAEIFPDRQLANLSCMLALAIAVVSWFALSAQTDITIGRVLGHGMSVMDGLARLSSYLTNLTILLSAVSFSALALQGSNPVNRFFRKPQVITAVVAYLVFVGIAYNLLLRQLWQPAGFRALVNESLHTVIPLLSMVYWIFFVPSFQPSLKKSLLWLVYPVVYLFVTLWRGDNSGFYPYPFINVRDLGYPHVLLNSVGLFAGFLLLMGLLLLINHSGKAIFLRR